MPDPPDVLYHYTTAAGLLGIVSERRIWATRAQYLNDAKEVSHAFEVANGLLPELEARNTSGSEAFRSYLETSPIMPWVFVTAWTENGDQLSQWRGYGGGVGPAYSLGFEGAALAQAARQEGWRLERCIYGAEEQTALIRRQMENFYVSFEQEMLIDHNGDVLDQSPRFAQAFSNQLFSNLLLVAPMLKHPAFAEEAEWRLISPISSELGIEHRAGPHTIVPYTSFCLPVRNDVLDIRDTVIGPTPASKEAAQQAVFSLYRAKRAGRFNSADRAVHGGVRLSGIPYRYW